MSSALRPVFVVGGIALIVSVVVGVSDWRAAHAVEVVPWRTDWAAARAESEKTHKPIFIDFTASWCPPCQQMKRTTWANNTVKQVMEKYVPVKVDVDAQPDIAQQFGVNAMPTMIIVSEQGEILRRRTGLMMPDEMLGWLEN